MSVYVNSPADLRANVPYQEYVSHQDKRGNNVIAFRNYVTEDLKEFKTSVFEVRPGHEHKEAYGFMADVWTLLERIVPWVRTIIGPEVYQRDRVTSAWRRVPSLIADTEERVFGMTMLPLITTIAISSGLNRMSAIRSALGAGWTEIENIARQAYGQEWLDDVSASLTEIQADVIAEGYTSEEERRRDAFVAYVVNSMNGAVRTSDAETPLCYRVFAEAEEGELARKLYPHRRTFRG